MTAIAPAKLWDWAQKALALTLSVISLGLVVVGAGIASAAVLGPGRDRPLLLFPFFVTFMFLNILIHEMGHAVAAWSVGRRVHLIVVGPFAWRVKLRKFALSSSLEGAGRRWGGFVLSTPPPGQSWERGKIFFFAAGALANFAAGALAIAVFLLTAKQPAGISAGFALSTFSTGLYNLIPVRAFKGERTDGGKILRAVMGTQMTAHQDLLTRFKAFRYDGTESRDWEPDFVRRLEQSPDADSLSASMLLTHYLSAGDIVRAHDVMERLCAAAPDKSGPFATCRAFLVAIVERDAEKADAILAAAPPASKDDSLHLMAVMVIAGLRGDWDKADAAVAKVRAAVAKGSATSDRDDEMLFAAIVNDRTIPRSFRHPAAA